MNTRNLHIMTITALIVAVFSLAFTIASHRGPGRPPHFEKSMRVHQCEKTQKSIEKCRMQEKPNKFEKGSKGHAKHKGVGRGMKKEGMKPFPPHYNSIEFVDVIVFDMTEDLSLTAEQATEMNKLLVDYFTMSEVDKKNERVLRAKTILAKKQTNKKLKDGIGTILTDEQKKLVEEKKREKKKHQKKGKMGKGKKKPQGKEVVKR